MAVCVLALSIREEETRRTAFAIVTTIVSQHLDFVVNCVPTLIDLLEYCAKKGEIADSAVFTKLALALPAESELWLRLVAMIRDGPAFAAVLGAAARDRCPLELIEVLVDRELPRFCTDTQLPFFTDLAPLFLESKGILMQVLSIGIDSGNEAVEKAAIECLGKFAQNLESADLAALVDKFIRRIGQFTIGNISLFLSVLNEILDRLIDHGKVCLRRLEEVATAENLVKTKAAVLIAGARFALHNCLEKERPFPAQEMAEAIGVTLRLFAESGFPADAESVGGRAWADAIAEIVRRMNGFDRDKFQRCFSPSKDLLLSLIVTATPGVRAEIGRTLQLGMK
jgi:hypothetical protein